MQQWEEEEEEEEVVEKRRTENGCDRILPFYPEAVISITTSPSLLELYANSPGTFELKVLNVQTPATSPKMAPTHSTDLNGCFYYYYKHDILLGEEGRGEGVRVSVRFLERCIWSYVYVVTLSW